MLHDSHIARLQVEGDKWELYIPSKLGLAPRTMGWC